MQFSERIEAFENETAVVAKEFVKTNHTKQYDSIVVIALNPLTFTSRASHAGFQPRVIQFYQNYEQAASLEIKTQQELNTLAGFWLTIPTAS